MFFFYSGKCALTASIRQCVSAHYYVKKSLHSGTLFEKMTNVQMCSFDKKKSNEKLTVTPKHVHIWKAAAALA